MASGPMSDRDRLPFEMEFCTYGMWSVWNSSGTKITAFWIPK